MADVYICAVSSVVEGMQDGGIARGETYSDFETRTVLYVSIPHGGNVSQD